MIKNVVENMGGIDTYGVVSICLFFTVFLGAVIWAMRIKKSHADSMSALPLDDAEPKTNPDNTSNA